MNATAHREDLSFICALLSLSYCARVPDNVAVNVRYSASNIDYN